jgi:branched-chain amino acid transport system substrate-binding protein
VAQIKALREAGYQGKILTTSAFAFTQALEEAGAAAEGLFFTQTVFDLASEAEPIRGFRESYRMAYGEDPGIYAAHGYDAMKILAEALRKGGTLPSDFEKGILGISSFPGVTGSLQFDEKGDVQKYPRVYRIKDGQPLNYEEYVRDMKQAFQKRMQEIEQRRKALLRGQR